MRFFQEFWHHFKLLPSAWLLLIQLLMLVIVPFINHNQASSAVAWIFSAIALLLVANIIRITVASTIVGLMCVLPALCLSIIVFLGYGNSTLVIAANLFEATAYFVAAYRLTLYMFADRYLTRDELFAAASVFTLIVWGFAFLYSACQAWDIHSFTLQDENSRSWLSLIFLSFSVQSGTGLSEIYPENDIARVLVALQMFCGVMYLALIVSRLVALQYIKHQPKKPSDDEKS
ncbi:two pore domain potassium channel family protein [Acinetobacter qingfengensis]|uniref:Ion channel n=1 Tax=Acinetobacter qingfengensis TaxID=1262585 RepID=A0A1E7QZ40_9GAMM|nr:ion channel [Acinetobacter qingfengensis]KAA8733153.1 two pore domain potassium channel family protein [Acinetobacter qingfengensis]OEY92303.1 ion channel [Acinetobacter qingfengensis]